MSYPIPTNPAWDVLDNTKLADYRTCPRLYLYRHLLGLQPAYGEHDLLFGQWWHEAMEYLLHHGYEPLAQANAIKLFCKLWTEHYGQIDGTEEDRFRAKTPVSVATAIPQYCAQWAARDADDRLVGTELPSSLPLNADNSRLLHFRIDGILLGRNGYFVREHKTTSWTLGQMWEAQFGLSFQITTYMHVLYSLLDPARVYGVEVNGVGFFKKGIEFKRLMLRRGVNSMQNWFNDINAWVDRLDEDMERLTEADPASPGLGCFPRNDKACFLYMRQCPYYNFCLASHNPLTLAEAHPEGFVKRFWNPLEQEDRNDAD